MDTEVQNSNYLRALQEIEKSEESKEDHDKLKHVCKKDVPIAEFLIPSMKFSTSWP